jgi:hypothetical protein
MGTEFTIMPVQDWQMNDDDLPSYKDPGDILVHVMEILPGSNWPRYELEVLDYDSGSSLMWMQEGIGVEYWLRDGAYEFPSPGYYVIEGVTGTYYRGDGYTTDDDEEWDYKGVREATRDEIVSMCLCGIKETIDDILFDPITKEIEQA